MPEAAGLLWGWRVSASTAATCAATATTQVTFSATQSGGGLGACVLYASRSIGGGVGIGASGTATVQVRGDFSGTVGSAYAFAPYQLTLASNAATLTALATANVGVPPVWVFQVSITNANTASAANYTVFAGLQGPNP